MNHLGAKGKGKNKILRDLIKDFDAGDLRSLARLISLVEGKNKNLLPILGELFGRRECPVIGLTGPPGAGKSTLCNSFIRFAREQNKRVGVVGVDPTSPFTSGALLGDRIRLSDHFNDPGVYIRSLSTRGKLGGLSLATREVVHLLSAFGFEQILLETVGVGQNEVDVRNVADVTVVVLIPEWGDAIQVMKSGVLEIGDILVVNKADRSGAEKLHEELKARTGVPVFLTKKENEGSSRVLYQGVMGFLNDHKEVISNRRRVFMRETVKELLESTLIDQLKRWVDERVKTTQNPYLTVLDFLSKNKLSSVFSADGS